MSMLNCFPEEKIIYAVFLRIKVGNPDESRVLTVTDFFGFDWNFVEARKVQVQQLSRKPAGLYLR